MPHKCNFYPQDYQKVALIRLFGECFAVSEEKEIRKPQFINGETGHKYFYKIINLSHKIFNRKQIL